MKRSLLYSSLLVHVQVLLTYFQRLSLTVGLPTVILLLVQNSKSPKGSVKNYILLLLSAGFSWVLGYALLWATKWGLASIVMKENIFFVGIQSIIYRSGGLRFQG